MKRRLLFVACLFALFTVGVSLSALAQPFDPALFSELRWRMIGPFRGGRTVAVSGVPKQPNVFYMAPNNGGVWKSDDYGHTWNPIFDEQPTGSVGALAVAPSDPNVIYVGSGEGLQRPDLSVGDGVYKSTDAGKTWKNLGLADGRQIGAILVDPRNAGRLFVAVLGHPYGPNAERGVYRSADGGATFQRVLFKDEDTGAIDLAFDPSDASTVYAVLWAARQGPWEYGNAYRGPGSGLFKSTDGGGSWQPLKQGLPTPEEGLGRIGIAVAPSDPKRLYAVVEATPSGLYRSDDSGASWKRVNSERRISGRASDFAEVKVDPRNADVVWVANTSTYRSTDGGKSFTAVKGAPGGDDYHRIWISPENPDVILLGSDQGATLSVNGGRTWSSWYNQPTAQFFHVVTDGRFPYRVYGGQQESGSAGVLSRGNDGAITFREFHPAGGDEYGYMAPDPLHPGIVYGGKVARYDEQTGQVREVGPVALRTGKHRFDRTAPVIFSPADPHFLFFASEILWKTTNGGESWDEISPDLTRESPGVPPSLGTMADKDPASDKHRGVIYSIAPSPLDVGLIWVGTDDGLVHVTRDGGTTWQNVTPAGLQPWSKVTQIDASRFDPATAYVSVSRFRLDDLSPHVYRTHDGGKTWTTIVSGLPDNASVNVVREDPVRRGLLYAGTERQVWVSFDDGDHWQSLRLNMPATSIRDLVVHGEDLVVGTHGRSFWILDDVTPLRQLGPEVAASAFHLFAPARAVRVRVNTNTDTPLPPEEPAGKNPPEGAVLDYWLRGKNDAMLEIFDAAGKLVRKFATSETPEPVDAKELAIPVYWIRPERVLSGDGGMHRFVWDLRFPPPAADDHEYPIAAIAGDTPRHPVGPWVLPGSYTAKLTAGHSSLTRPLEVAMDPRVSAPAEDLAGQLDLALRITGAMREDFDVLRKIRDLRRRVGTIPERARGATPFDALEKKLAVLEPAKRERPSEVPDAPAADSLSRLNARLATLLNVVESADARPTAQAAAAFQDVRRSLDALLQRWREIEAKDLPAVEKKLGPAGPGR